MLRTVLRLRKARGEGIIMRSIGSERGRHGIVATVYTLSPATYCMVGTRVMKRLA